MKALYTISIFIFLIFDAFGQTPETNLQKYWNQRDRFRKQFCEIGTGKIAGMSLPFELNMEFSAENPRLRKAAKL